MERVNNSGVAGCEMSWGFGERVNNDGEWNPRLISCDVCGVYVEPEELMNVHKNVHNTCAH